MSTQKPSPGRVVFYVAPEGVTRPAIIIAPCIERFPGSAYVRDECQLHVFFDGSNDGEPDKFGARAAPYPWRTSVPYDEGKAVGTWHFPPRV